MVFIIIFAFFIPNPNPLILSPNTGFLSFNNIKKEGVSFVMLNSKKGEDLFGLIRANLLADERNLNEASKSNSALRGRNTNNRFRALFFLVYKYNPQIALHLFTLPHRLAVWFRDLIRHFYK